MFFLGVSVKSVSKPDWMYSRHSYKSKSLHSRKSFVLGELSFARMPSRQYCLKVNKLHCWNCRPELVNCGQWQPWGVVTQHGKTQILGLPKLLQKLIPPHICWNWTFLRISKFWSFHLGSPHLVAVTGCNGLILANNFKTEVRSSSTNNISKACWQKKVLPEQVISETFYDELIGNCTSSSKFV